MAYNYLGLVNDVCERFNETPLNSSTFASASGFYATAKQAVNNAVQLINQEDFTWPFNFNRQDTTLTEGTMRYSYPSGVKWIDYNHFVVKRDATLGNTSRKLKVMDYEEFRDHKADDEYNTDTGIRGLPTHVTRAPSLEFLVWPIPDEDYPITYETYLLPVALSAYDDVPSIPEAFRHVIVDGAMREVYLFQSNIEAYDRIRPQFEAGVKNLKSIYINRFEGLRSTMILQRSSTDPMDFADRDG